MGDSAQFYRRSAGVPHPQQLANWDSIPERSEAWYQAYVAAGGGTRAPSHMSDYVITEFGAFDFGGALH